jgi:RNase adaptor protein for sRNA GlmZ degradation
MLHGWLDYDGSLHDLVMFVASFKMSPNSSKSEFVCENDNVFDVWCLPNPVVAGPLRPLVLSSNLARSNLAGKSGLGKTTS